MNNITVNKKMIFSFFSGGLIFFLAHWSFLYFFPQVPHIQYQYREMAMNPQSKVATFQNETIFYGNLMKEIQGEVFELEQKIYDLKLQKIKGKLLDKMVESSLKEHEAKTGSLMAKNDFIDQVIAKDIKISNEEILDVLKKQGLSAEEGLNTQDPMLQNQLRSILILEKKKQKVQQWFEEQLALYQGVIFLPRPRRPFVKIDLGLASTAKTQMVIVVDFQCQFSQKMNEIIKRIQQKYADSVHFSYRNFPLPFHNLSKQAAMRSLCAWEQGPAIFGEVYDLLFSTIPGATSEEKLAEIDLKIEKLKIDRFQFQNCLKSATTQEKILEDIQWAKSVGVKSTPTLFINGEFYQGVQSYELLEEVIKQNTNTL